MINPVEEFADDILLRWPPPRTWNAQQTGAWAADLVDTLAGRDKEVLDRALKVLIGQKRQYAGTPQIPDVLAAVKQASGEVAAEKRAAQLNLGDGSGASSFSQVPVKDRAWTSDGVKMAYELLRTEAGRTAAAEGYVRPFWCFVATYKCMPGKGDIPALKRSQQEFNEEFEALARKPGTIAATLYRMAQDIVIDQQRLADIANQKSTPPRADYFKPIRPRMAEAIAEIKRSPPSKYADENAEEGRGWKGMTA